MTELGKSVGLSGQCFPVRSLTRNNAIENGYAGESDYRLSNPSRALDCREILHFTVLL